MSKMSELATVLDELTETGRNLMACGEDMIVGAALGTIAEKIGTFIAWIVKKVRQHREKRLAKRTEQA